MILKYKKLNSKAITPTRAYSTDSGLDIYSVKEDHILYPQECSLIETGLAFQIPEPESWFTHRNKLNIVYELQARSKSGIALKKMMGLGNGVGTIDNSYTGEVKGIIFNYGKEPQEIKYGQKIFQLVLCPVVIPELEEILEIKQGERAANGYGSTGVID